MQKSRKSSASVEALQQQLRASDDERQQLRQRNSELELHVRLLRRELSSLEAEVATASPKAKSSRRKKQMVLDGVRTGSIGPASSAEPSAADFPRRRPPASGSPGNEDDLLVGEVGLNEMSHGRSPLEERSIAASTASSEGGQSNVSAASPPPGSSSAAAPAKVDRLLPGKVSPFECPPVERAAASSSTAEVDFDRLFCDGPKNDHAWTRCPGRAFNVRTGPNYAKTGKKLPSLDPLYDVADVYAFSCPDNKTPDLGRMFNLPKEDCLGPHGVPANLVLTVLLPDYAPALFASRQDGPGWAFAIGCRLSAAARQQLRSGELSPALKLWKSVVGAPADSPLRKRLKCICGLANPSEIGFDKVTNGLVTKYNAKPFMCISSGVYHAGATEYFGVEVDVHRWGKLALNGFNMVKQHIQHMRMRFGIVIQGETDEELPEQMLACAYMSKLSSEKCPQVPAAAPAATAAGSPILSPMEC